MEQVTIGLAEAVEVLGTLAEALEEMVVTAEAAVVATLPDQVVQEALEELV
tara:strand:- start:170 stop:322 length:153 start_codon:yes stop_codon:yes gene_type:complete